MIGNNVEYIQANTEIKCLLRYFPIEYIKKIPDRLLEIIYKNSDEKYNIEVDPNKDLKSQNISKKTKDMLAVLTYNYWSNESEKQYINERLNKNEIKYQNEHREKYNPDNIFKDKKNNAKTKQIENENTSIVTYKESFFSKIISKIKLIFHR